MKAHPLSSRFSHKNSKPPGKREGTRILFDILDLQPVFASKDDYGWMKDPLTQAGFLEPISLFYNAGSGKNGIQESISSRPIALPLRGEGNYLYLPRITGNHARIDYHDAINLSGDMTLQWEGMLPLYAGSGSQNFISKGTDYNLAFEDDGRLIYFGTVHSLYDLAVRSTLPVSTPNGHPGAFRVIKSGTTITLYEHLAGSWVSIGTTSNLSYAQVQTNPSHLFFGAHQGAVDHARGVFRRIRIWNNANPDITHPIIDVDFSKFPHATTSGVALTGQTVNIERNGWDCAKIIGRPVFFMDGADDSFKVPELPLQGPMTFLYVAEWLNKESITWTNSISNYTCTAINGFGGTESNGNGIYTKNGNSLPLTSRSDLHQSISGRDLCLLSTTHNFATNPTEMQFGSYGQFGSNPYQWGGFVSELYAFNRTLTPRELSKACKFIGNPLLHSADDDVKAYFGYLKTQGTSLSKIEQRNLYLFTRCLYQIAGQRVDYWSFRSGQNMGSGTTAYSLHGKSANLINTPT